MMNGGELEGIATTRLPVQTSLHHPAQLFSSISDSLSLEKITVIMLLSPSILVGTIVLVPDALACSRVNYHAGVDDRITVGRSMDFVTSTNSSIYIFPAGQKRNGNLGENPLQWTSKYGSMITSMYDIVSIDGMNTEGLTGSVLYLGESDYGDRNSSRPGLAIGWWLQYCLDSFPTVAAAAKAIQGQDIQVITKEMVPGVSSTGHIMLSDKSGDNLIMEYLDNKLVIHHGTQYQVMTNDPTYDRQLAVDEYWEPIANQSLPGTSTPAGKFVSLCLLVLLPRCHSANHHHFTRPLRPPLLLQPHVAKIT